MVQPAAQGHARPQGPPGDRRFPLQGYRCGVSRPVTAAPSGACEGGTRQVPTTQVTGGYILFVREVPRPVTSGRLRLALAT